MPEGYKDNSRTFGGYVNQVCTKLSCVFVGILCFVQIIQYNVKDQMLYLFKSIQYDVYYLRHQ